MYIKYLGPSPEVIVGIFGPHKQNEIREYPDEVGQELLDTMHRQRFEMADGFEEPDPANMTTAQLLEDLASFHDPATLKRLKKADLVALWASTRSDLKALAG